MVFGVRPDTVSTPDVAPAALEADPTRTVRAASEYTLTVVTPLPLQAVAPVELNPKVSEVVVAEFRLACAGAGSQAIVVVLVVVVVTAASVLNDAMKTVVPSDPLVRPLA